MDSMDSRNRKIIDAVIRKEQAVCPGAVALIGIYGSFMTGDVHPLSDLDLLILINDDRGAAGSWGRFLFRKTWVWDMIFTAQAGKVCGRI